MGTLRSRQVSYDTCTTKCNPGDTTTNTRGDTAGGAHTTGHTGGTPQDSHPRRVNDPVRAVNTYRNYFCRELPKVFTKRRTSVASIKETSSPAWLENHLSTGGYYLSEGAKALYDDVTRRIFLICTRGTRISARSLARDPSPLHLFEHPEHPVANCSSMENHSARARTLSSRNFLCFSRLGRLRVHTREGQRKQQVHQGCDQFDLPLCSTRASSQTAIKRTPVQERLRVAEQGDEGCLTEPVQPKSHQPAN